MAKRCVRKKRVRVRGGGTALRCAKFSGRARSRKRRGSYRAKRRGSKRKPYGMARRGSKCLSYRTVRVRGQGTARRCRKFSSPRRRRSYGRRRAA